ncbi:MAG TPA: hypothetical protein VGT03_11570 [Candidatus Acidoferrales bacterium]|nr:hypothetical protein [Candidatus Acidoferrales bacterium]
MKNAASTAVAWSVNGVPDGNSALGTIVPTSAGADTATYSAPQVLPSPTSLTILATSQADPSANGSASVQIQSDVAVSILPMSANTPTSTTQVFTATVTGTGNPDIAVTWSVHGVSGGNSTVGTVLPTAADAATYTAPASVPSPPTVSLTATSIADSAKSASASVTITCAASSSLSPPTASVTTSATQAFTASLCVPPSTAVVWDVNGAVGGNSTLGTITPSIANSSIGTYSAPASVPTSNPVTIHAATGAQSARATVTITNPTSIVVTVLPPSASVSTGQRVSFSASVTGTSNIAVTWSVNGIANGNAAVGQVCAPSSNPCAPPAGSESAVDFLAPQNQPQPNVVALTAESAANPSSTASASVTITPPPPVTVSISPFYTFLDPSQQFQFVASVSGSTNQSVTWSVLSAVPGQGCSGALCGSIDNAGNYTAPAVAPSPNAISVIATSAASPAASATATVALLTGPVIETILPSSVIAGAPNSFLLAVQGLNFIPTTGSGSSQLLINGSARTTNCPISGRCTTTLGPSDVASAGVITVQIENPGAVPALSNPVTVVLLPAGSSPGTISLSNSSPLAQGEDIIVTEPTTAGATPSPINVDFAGPVSPDGSTCTIQGSPITVTRPSSGSASVNICVHGNYLDPTLFYVFSSPGTGGDIGVVPSSLASLFPNLIELTLTLSSTTVPGVRTLFITTPNGDVAVATGLLEVK